MTNDGPASVAAPRYVPCARGHVGYDWFGSCLACEAEDDPARAAELDFMPPPYETVTHA